MLEIFLGEIGHQIGGAVLIDQGCVLDVALGNGKQNILT